MRGRPLTIVKCIHDASQTPVVFALADKEGIWRCSDSEPIPIENHPDLIGVVRDPITPADEKQVCLLSGTSEVFILPPHVVEDMEASAWAMVSMQVIHEFLDGHGLGSDKIDNPLGVVLAAATGYFRLHNQVVDMAEAAEDAQTFVERIMEGGGFE